MSGNIIERKDPKPKHTCYPPGSFKRWLQKIGPNSIWMCNDCGAQWKLLRTTQRTTHIGPHDFWSRYR